MAGKRASRQQQSGLELEQPGPTDHPTGTAEGNPLADSDFLAYFRAKLNLALLPDEISDPPGGRIVYAAGGREIEFPIPPRDVHLQAKSAFSACLGILPTEVAPKIREWWTAWLQHEDYDWFYDPRSTGLSWAPEPDLYSPEVRVVFTHPPGVDGLTESAVFTSARDGLRHVRWGERTLGTFDGFDPIQPTDPVCSIRGGVLSNSFKGAGQAMWARRYLREMLPPSLRPWVSHARTANRHRKTDYLRAGWIDRFGVEGETKLWHEMVTHYGGPKNWPRSALPEWYTGKEMWELWFAYKVPQNVQDQIKRFMSLHDFWRCATGRVHPNDVAALVTHQLHLF